MVKHTYELKSIKGGVAWFGLVWFEGALLRTKIKGNAHLRYNLMASK